jgi:uncharacterized protein
MAEVMIPGCAGKIEGTYYNSRVPTGPMALLLPQHPAFDGSKDHQTLTSCYQALAHRGFSVLRINYRGIGKSNGEFGITERDDEMDTGEGEVSDANSALDFMHSRHGSVPCMVVGFSYGAWIGAQVMARRPEVTDLVCVSPQPNIYDFSFMSSFCPASSLIISAGGDQVVPRQSIDEMMFALATLQHGKAEHVRVPGAGHLFNGAIPEMMKTILQYVERRF